MTATCKKWVIKSHGRGSWERERDRTEKDGKREHEKMTDGGNGEEKEMKRVREMWKEGENEADIRVENRTTSKKNQTYSREGRR